MIIENIKIEYMPKITEKQLWDFYVRNDICETGFGKEIATKVLKFNPYIVAAFYDEKLVGIIRSMFDGVSAEIMEFCLELELQGKDLKYENGSLIEKDEYGIAKRMGVILIDELKKMGNTYINAYIVEDLEEDTYVSIGMKENKGHLAFSRDERPYIK